MTSSESRANPPDDRGMYTVEEVARFLSMPRSTVYDLIKSHKLQAVKIGGRYRFPRKPIDDLMRGEEPK